MDLRSIVMTLWNLFFEASLALGFIPEEADERATEQVDRTVLIRQLVLHSVRACASGKRLISAKFRCLYKQIAQDCAHRAILRGLAASAVEKVTISLKKKHSQGSLNYNRETNPALVAGFQNIHSYVGGKRLLTSWDTSHYITRITHNGSDYFCVWFDPTDNDDCENGDSRGDCKVAELLYSATTPDEIVRITCDDLRAKVMSGKVFSSLAAIAVHAEFHHLYQLGTHVKNLIREQAIANASTVINAMIAQGEPATLRQLMIATGHANLSHFDGFELGKYVCAELGYKERSKVEVYRDGQIMRVSLYTPDEFAKIAFLISEWTSGRAC